MESLDGNRQDGRCATFPMLTPSEQERVYTFRYQAGRWELAEYKKKGASTTSPRRATSSSAKQWTASRNATYRRSTGSGYRASGRSYAYPTLRRIVGAGMSLYRFVRNEEDRDLLRAALLGEAIDEEKLGQLIDRVSTTLPQAELGEFEQTVKNPEEIKSDDLDKVTDDDWGQLDLK